MPTTRIASTKMYPNTIALSAPKPKATTATNCSRSVFDSTASSAAHVST
jgi:hypothetical protein